MKEGKPVIIEGSHLFPSDFEILFKGMNVGAIGDKEITSSKE